MKRIEAGHPQQPGQRAGMGVGDELRFPRRLFANTEQGRDVEGLELRMDRDAVALAQPPIKAGRLAADKNRLDFGVRHAQGLSGRLRRLALFFLSAATMIENGRDGRMPW